MRSRGRAARSEPQDGRRRCRLAAALGSCLFAFGCSEPRDAPEPNVEPATSFAELAERLDVREDALARAQLPAFRVIVLADGVHVSGAGQDGPPDSRVAELVVPLEVFEPPSNTVDGELLRPLWHVATWTAEAEGAGRTEAVAVLFDPEAPFGLGWRVLRSVSARFRKTVIAVPSNGGLTSFALDTREARSDGVGSCTAPAVSLSPASTIVRAVELRRGTRVAYGSDWQDAELRLALDLHERMGELSAGHLPSTRLQAQEICSTVPPRAGVEHLVAAVARLGRGCDVGAVIASKTSRLREVADVVRQLGAAGFEHLDLRTLDPTSPLSQCPADTWRATLGPGPVHPSAPWRTIPLNTGDGSGDG